MLPIENGPQCPFGVHTKISEAGKAANGSRMIELTEADILSRLKNTEDSTVERKVASDYRDCLKTAVGFSNSLPVDDPGIIFVGVFDDGRVQENNRLDSLQKDVSKELNKIYPPIEAQLVVRKDESGKEFLVLIVRGSPNRPHFAGPSYIRDGSQTKEASDPQFERLIAERNSKVRYILNWKGKEITLQWLEPGPRPPIKGVLTECNQHYIIINEKNAIPLDGVSIVYDPSQNRLKLDIRYNA